MKGGALNLRDVDDAAERVPLGAQRVDLDDLERAEAYELGEQRQRRSKGKGRMVESDYHEDGEENGGKAVFAIEDEDDDKDR